MKRPFSTFFLTLLAVLLPAYLRAEDAPQPDQSITYKVAGEKPLQLHLFEPANDDRSEPRPAIVFFFGGGWRKGSPSQFYPHAAYLASRGMVAFVAEYRVSERDGTTPQECVMDGKSALRWVREHADEFGIDPTRIAAGGGSAGGHIAAATALVEGFNDSRDDLAVSCQPDALVLFNPVIDNGPDGYGFDRVSEYWETFSPLHNIGPDAPPTLFMLGTEDGLIPVETAEAYKAKMESFNRRCDLHLYADQPHGFFNYRHTTYYTMTVVEIDLFLASLGYLNGPPTLKVTIDPSSERTVEY